MHLSSITYYVSWPLTGASQGCVSKSKEMLVTGVEGGETFLPVLQVIHHLQYFLHYVGPPFCNASDSKISGFVGQLNAGRKV